jgi:hypothetical protein
MEVIGLALALPAVVVANVAYVLAVRFGAARFPRLRVWLLWPSYAVVALALFDVVLVLTFGAAAARTRVGPAFWSVHEVVFIFGAPSLVNVLMLTRRGVWFRHWYATVVLSCCVGIFLVFFQVGVGDALFGPDGVGGPFSELAPHWRLQPTATVRSRAAAAGVLMEGLYLPRVTMHGQHLDHRSQLSEK